MSTSYQAQTLLGLDVSDTDT